VKSASGPNFCGYVRDHLASKGFAAAWTRKIKKYIIYKVLFLINNFKIDFLLFSLHRSDYFFAMQHEKIRVSTLCSTTKRRHDGLLDLNAFSSVNHYLGLL
jgi:hypothetical protein